MLNSLNILFFPKKGRSTPDDQGVLYTRITYNGKRTEFSTSRKINLRLWSSKSGKAKGTSEESRAVNRFLDSIRASLYEIHDRLLRESRRISATTIKEIYLGKEEKQYMLCLLYTSPSPRDRQKSRMPSSA